jgi:hypothetical protein
MNARVTNVSTERVAKYTQLFLAGVRFGLMAMAFNPQAMVRYLESIAEDSLSASTPSQMLSKSVESTIVAANVALESMKKAGQA